MNNEGNIIKIEDDSSDDSVEEDREPLRWSSQFNSIPVYAYQFYKTGDWQRLMNNELNFHELNLTNCQIFEMVITIYDYKRKQGNVAFLYERCCLDLMGPMEALHHLEALIPTGLQFQMEELGDLFVEVIKIVMFVVRTHGFMDMNNYGRFRSIIEKCFLEQPTEKQRTILFQLSADLVSSML